MRQFRQVRKNPRVDKSSSKGPVLEAETSLPPAPWSSLVKPAIFTAGFCGATMAGCAIWQYENMRSEALKAKMMNFGFGWKDNSARYKLQNLIKHRVIIIVELSKQEGWRVARGSETVVDEFEEW